MPSLHPLRIWAGVLHLPGEEIGLSSSKSRLVLAQILVSNVGDRLQRAPGNSYSAPRGETGGCEPAERGAAAGGLGLRKRGEAPATVARCGPSHHHRCQASREGSGSGASLLGPVAGRDRARRTLAFGLGLDEDDQGLG